MQTNIAQSIVQDTAIGPTGHETVPCQRDGTLGDVSLNGNMGVLPELKDMRCIKEHGAKMAISQNPNMDQPWIFNDEPASDPDHRGICHLDRTGFWTSRYSGALERDRVLERVPGSTEVPEGAFSRTPEGGSALGQCSFTKRSTSSPCRAVNPSSNACWKWVHAPRTSFFSSAIIPKFR